MIGEEQAEKQPPLLVPDGRGGDECLLDLCEEAADEDDFRYARTKEVLQRRGKRASSRERIR